ncbi:hypothetical protein JK232_02440 [Nissabacter archeti]|uniref:Uncharacterized protein n=1 Tax=Nissabacter archeti TaxID=1917880 RepID=A0ABS5JEQ0_9GAMM|nr:hypothetical protein [Nissabacter archeti]MBS0967743.1 hypothetical protein [Nissabacter archeti]
MLTSHEQDVYDNLPVELRPKYLDKLRRIKERDALIVAGALKAVECARQGLQHERLNRMRLNALNKEAAFYPLCPEHILAKDRRAFTREQPANTDIYLDYTNPIRGFGGAVRQG